MGWGLRLNKNKKLMWILELELIFFGFLSIYEFLVVWRNSSYGFFILMIRC